MSAFQLPSSPVADAVIAVARADEHPSLFHHSLRSYFHAHRFAQRQGVLGDLSDDLLFAATVLHELGAGSKAPGRERFEIEGADLAAATLLAAGVGEAEVQQVWDAIALHTSAGLAERRSLLCRVVRAGIVADFARASEPDRRLQDELHAAWPRLALEMVLVDSILERAQEPAALPRYGLPGVIQQERAERGITAMEAAAAELGW